MDRSRLSAARRCVLLVCAGLISTACGGGGGGGTSTSAAPTAPTPTSTAAAPSSPSTGSTGTTGATGGTGTSAPPAQILAGPVWPIEPRTVHGSESETVAALRSMRAGRHANYERLVLEFSAPIGEVGVRYVPIVRADPSDRVVTLQGRAFLQLVVHHAVARWPAAGVAAYSGPTTITPGFPTLRQVAISGDFEQVLSVGVGVARTAGFQLQRLTGPPRVVLDVAEPPLWRMWPDDSPAAARAAQQAFEQGHQPWRGDPSATAEAYARAVYGWDHPAVTPIAGTAGFRLAHAGSPDAVTIQTARAFPASGRTSIVEVIDTR